MAIDFTGITNENEFYTHHYLSAILESDLKDVLKKWKDLDKVEDIRPPYVKLKAISQEYFNIRSQEKKARKPEDKLQYQRQFMQKFLPMLGFEFNLELKELEDGSYIPAIGTVNKQSGAPELWIIEALDVLSEDINPLELSISDAQYPETDHEIHERKEEQKKNCNKELLIEELIARQVFALAEPPRWVLVASLSHVLLIDRTKWNQKRMLRFDLSEILGRRELSTLQVFTVLLHRDSVCPEEGLSLLDNLDESSHKHAFSVSEDLKYALRQSIELLGNEALTYLKEISKEKVYDREVAEQLTIECLRYMYRLLFLFYIEARPELGYAPMKSDAYRMGYSLETLRDFEMVQLTTEESRNGFFIHESLQLLFDLIYNGFQPKGTPVQQKFPTGNKPQHHIFNMSSLKSHLFEPDRTQLLNKVKFRNSVLQDVIKKMSLSRPKSRRERRGRISYAQLGINQLGAVYEALLSYRGFFAETDLYEVKKAGEKHNELETAYFVKEDDINKYAEDERVFNDDGSLVKYSKGTFIYRLAGRDRQKSASYYTPEVLTRCLVKYALKELLEGKTADDILKLTICEPAMGSAAFLNEAVNQLAESYLQLKQKETDQLIPHEKYAQEKQKVKMFLADNNVFGVDLNPVAVELAEVSLWLNTIHEGALVPWFGMQLVCGNSLIGARKQSFDSLLLRKSRNKDPLWLDEVPDRVMPGDKREKNTVYHFLLPDRGMADYKDKVIKQMAADEIKSINEWRKEFTKPFTKEEIDQLEKLSMAVDKLWERHTHELQKIKARTTDPIDVFGQENTGLKKKFTDNKWKDKIFQEELLSKNVRSSSAYRRLKLVMDYWCSLWFWPIEKAEFLPSRYEMLLELSLILEGNVFDTSSQIGEQLSLFPDTKPKQRYLELVDEYGYVDVDKLCRENERLGLVKTVSENYRFLHWELEFADVFQEKSGFDLVLGNPPWIKVKWEETSVLGDCEPLVLLRGLVRNEHETYLKYRKNLLENVDIRNLYLKEYTDSAGLLNYLNSQNNYPELAGVQSNLYKCFFSVAWTILGYSGFGGMLHDKGLYDDPKGRIIRENLYYRLFYYFRFYNQLNYFPEEVLGHAGEFCITIFSSLRKKIVNAKGIFNLINHKTIDDCFINKDKRIYGLKNESGDWEFRGNNNRIIDITNDFLSVCTEIIEEKNTPFFQSKIALLQSNVLADSLLKVSTHSLRLEKLNQEIITTQMFDEKGAVEKGLIKKQSKVPDAFDKVIFSGPHYYVMNPCAKSPNIKAKSKGDYNVTNLEDLPFEYIPRTVFQLNKNVVEYANIVPNLESIPVINFSRFVCRKMAQPSNERTLIPTLIPKGAFHTNSSFSITHRNPNVIVLLVGCAGTILYDFIIRLTGRSNILFDTLKCLPIVDDFKSQIIIRSLRLNCLTKNYSDVWADCWSEEYKNNYWMINDKKLISVNKILKTQPYDGLTEKLKKTYAFRNIYQRRLCQIELDVIVAKSLGISLDELKSIYKLQFPTLYKNEKNTWFDQNGRTVFTINRNLTGVGLKRNGNKKTGELGWDDIKDMKEGKVEQRVVDIMQNGEQREHAIVYDAPFDRCDREKDYEIVWTEFEKRFGTTEHANNTK